MKTLRFGFLFIALAQIAGAVDFSIDPVALAKALLARAPASTSSWRRVTGAIALAGNGIDWYQTEKYAGPGGGGCEQNPLFLTAPCKLNVPKFRLFKAILAGAIVAEEVPGLFHLRHSEEWDKVWLIANVPLDVILVSVTLHNAASIRQIRERKGSK
jgi:hypothetical protein